MLTHFYNVEWDLDDGETIEDAGLDTDFTREIYVDDDCDNLDDLLSDWLSDEYAYCHRGFDYEVLDKKNDC